MNNRLWNCKNPHQGAYKKVLCVCSAGLLRSPTAAIVLANPPFNFNTRSVGIDNDHALIKVDEVLMVWADEIVVMTHDQGVKMRSVTDKPVYSFDIPDNYSYRDPALIKLIEEKALNLWPQ